jgi:transcription termination factor Rho
MRKNSCIKHTFISSAGKSLKHNGTEVQLKVKVKIKFRPEEATNAQRGSTGIALLFP